MRLPRASIAIFPDMSDWEWSRLGGTLGLSQRKSTGQRRSCECWLKFERWCCQQGEHTVASSSNIIEGRGSWVVASTSTVNADGRTTETENGGRFLISPLAFFFSATWR